MSVANFRFLISAVTDRRYKPIEAKQKAPTHEEKGRQIFCALLIFPEQLCSSWNWHLH
jgi:hypothetical protein